MADDQFFANETFSPSNNGGFVSSYPPTISDEEAERIKQEQGVTFQEAAPEGPISLDAYKQELSQLLEPDSFWELPYEEKVDQVRKVYLGPDLKGERSYVDENEVTSFHQQTLADIRDYDGVKFDFRDIASQIPEPPPDLIKAIKNGSPEEIDKGLDEWEATTIRGNNAKGIAWKEIASVAEPLIKERVDFLKNALKAEAAYGKNPDRLDFLASNIGQVFRSGMETLAGLVPGEFGDELARSARTAEGIPPLPIPGLTQGIPLPPIASTLEPAPELDIKGLKINSEGLAKGFGSSAAFMGIGATGAVAGGAAGAAAALIPAAGRLGYAEAYDTVYQRTGDVRKASVAGWKNAFVESVDAMVDSAILFGGLSATMKAIPYASKINALAELTTRGYFGEAFRNGFKVAAKVGIEGATEAAQEFATGEVLANATGDESLRATPGQMATAAIVGSITALGASGSPRLPTSPVTQDVLREAGLEAQSVIQETATPQARPIPMGAPTQQEFVGTKEEQAKFQAELNPQVTPTEPEAESEISPLREALDDTESKTSNGKDVTVAGKEFSFSKQDIPLTELVVQKDIPNFKLEADKETGVVGGEENISSSFSDVSGGNIVVLEKDVTRGGEKEVLSGRNRFRIAQKDPNKQSISAIVIKESEGFSVDDAKILDAELNIKEGQGTTEDYAKFFERSKLTEDQARNAKLFRNARARKAFSIGSKGSPELRSSFFSGNIGEKAAELISEAAPNNSELQRLGLQQIQKGSSPENAANIVQVAKRATGIGGTSVQGDLFGANDTALRDAERLGTAATELQKENNQTLNALIGARKLGKFKGLENLPGINRGVDIKDVRAVDNEINRLEVEKERLKNWYLHPDLTKQVQERAVSELAQSGEQLSLDITTPISRRVAPIEPKVSTPAPKPFGISAAAESSFGTSEVFEKAEASREAAIEAGTPEAAPFGEVTRTELVSQEAGQYYKTSMAEQDFFAERFLEGKDREALARDIANPETADPLTGLPETTKSVVLAKILDDIDTRQRAAEAAGDTVRAQELSQLGVETYVTYQTSRTGTAQALGVGRLNNEILGITSADQIVGAVEDIVSSGRNLTPETQKEMLGLSNEADAIAADENKLAETASRVEANQKSLERLRNKVDEKRTRLGELQNELKAKKDALQKERNSLAGKDKRLTDKAERAIPPLMQDIEVLEKQVADAQESLRRTQENFSSIQDALKSDISDLRSLRRQLEKRKNDLTKKQLSLRQKRAAEKERLVFRTLPRSVQGRIKALADKFVAAPKGSFIRQELAAEMIQIGIEASGGFSPLEIGNAIWYTNALSGFSTQGISLWGNGIALIARSTGYLIRNPKEIIPYFQVLIEATEKGAVEFKSIVREGRSGRGSLEGKLTPGNVKAAIEYLQEDSSLEILFGSKQGTLPERVSKTIQTTKSRPGTEATTGFGVGKFTNRLLRGGDAFFYRLAHDAMAAAVLAKQARLQGKTDAEIADIISENLFMSGTRASEALIRAEKSLKDAFGDGGYSQNDVTRGALELLDQQLPENVRNEADRWGSLATYTQELNGVFGTLAKGVKSALEHAVVPTKYGELQVLRPFFPFVDIVANVAETGLEFSPAGILKAAAQKNRAQQIEIGTNAILGSALGAILFGLANDKSDDDDPVIAIYGSGDPLRPERKNQLRQIGWRPYTIKIGDNYIPYQETPLYWLSAFGSYFDNKRWNSKFGEKAGENYLRMLIGGIGSSFLEQGTLKGLSAIFDTLKGESGSMTSGSAQFLGVFLPGGAIARDLDRIFNAQFQEVVPEGTSPRSQMAQNFVGSVFKNYPVAGEMINRPLLNGFGEELSPEIEERFGLIRRSLGTWRKDNIDPEWKFLAENGLTFSGFGRKITIGDIGQSSSAKALKMNTMRQRSDTLGRIWTETFTPEERYEFIQLAGPKIKKAIAQVMTTAGNKNRFELQSEVDKAVTKAKKEAKIAFVNRMKNWKSYQKLISDKN